MPVDVIDVCICVVVGVYSVYVARPTLGQFTDTYLIRALMACAYFNR